MDIVSISITAGVILVIVVLLIFLIKMQYKKVGPNEILIISGGKKNYVTFPDGSEKEIGFRFRIGGGTFVNPLTERAEQLKVEVVPIHMKSPELMTKNGSFPQKSVRFLTAPPVSSISGSYRVRILIWKFWVLR